MLLVAKLLVLTAMFAGSISVTKTYLNERSVLSQSGVRNQVWLVAVAFMWLCVILQLISILPRVSLFLMTPLPFGALLAIPPVISLKRINHSLQRQGTDRTKNARDATDRALLISYGAGALAILDWVMALAVSLLPNITGGQA